MAPPVKKMKTGERVHPLIQLITRLQYKQVDSICDDRIFFYYNDIGWHSATDDWELACVCWRLELSPGYISEKTLWIQKEINHAILKLVLRGKVRSRELTGVGVIHLSVARPGSIAGNFLLSSTVCLRPVCV